MTWWQWLLFGAAAVAFLVDEFRPRRCSECGSRGAICSDFCATRYWG